MNYLSIDGFSKKISRIILGSQFGEQSEKLSNDILDTYIALGGNAIDTANNYANGESERFLGRWLKEKGNRNEIIIIDKGCHPTVEEPRRLTPQHIRLDIEQSLDRLDCSYIDIFLLHRDDPTKDVGPILDTLNEEKAKGHILSFGASNWHHYRIAETIAYANSNNINGFCASSCNLSLAIPKEPMWPGSIYLNNESREWYINTQFPLLAWSSQARGWFSGRYSQNAYYDADVERVYHSKQNLERLKRVKLLAKYRKVTPVQCALAYVLNQSFPTFAIIGPKSSIELCESIAMPELTLSKEEMIFLETNYPYSQSVYLG